MKIAFVFLFLLSLLFIGCSANTENGKNSHQPQPVKVVHQMKDTGHLFMDVHELEPGKVTFEAVAEAHLKDLDTQGKYDVSFLKFWVDEAAGKVYCLSKAPSADAIHQTHAEAHGLTPDQIYQVKEGE